MTGEKEEREKRRRGKDGKENNSAAFTSLLVSLVDCAVTYLFIKADTLKDFESDC